MTRIDVGASEATHDPNVAPAEGTPQRGDLIAQPLRSLAVPIAALTSDPANVRVHDERNLAAIADSLRAFGQRKPIVVRREGMVVVAGNGTLAAAVVLDDDAITATRYAIADNRTAELAARARLASWQDAVDDE